MIKWLLSVLVVVQASAFGGVYITVSGANVQKPKIAVGKIHPLPGFAGGDAKLIRDVSEELRSDLEFANIVEFLPENMFAGLDQAKDLYQMPYEQWGEKGVSFVLKLAYKLEGEKLVLEAILHDVPGQKKIFGTRYQYAAKQYWRLVHTLAEDILKELAGERGLFLSRIAMSCRKNRDAKEIYVIAPDGRGMTAVTTDNTISLSPAWSPDGKVMLYTQYTNLRGTLKKGIVLKRHVLATGDRKTLSAREGVNSGGAWNPKKNIIALTLSYNGKGEIYLIAPNGESEPIPFSRDIQVKRVGGEGFRESYSSTLLDVEPSWSPDGNKIVFSSARTGNPMIYTVDTATKVATQLTFAGKYNATPAWSPKGDKILFAAQRIAEGNFDLYIIDPDGNNLNRMTNGEREGRRRVNSERPAWAPNGRHFAYSSNEDGTYGIYIMSTDGTQKRRVSPKGMDCRDPAWSGAE